jgi:hypothetical protein
MKKGCILATALFLISTIVFAASAQNVATAGKTQNLTGKELLGKITSPKPGDRDYALGFVTGVYCVSSGQGMVPDIASSEKIVQIVKKYLETHKDVLDRPASDLVISALKQHPPGK